MKVLQINSVCGVGSTGRIATDIHKLLIEQRHESYIAYGRELASNCNNTMKIGNKLDNYKHVAMTRILDKHGFGSKKATYEFVKNVKLLNPDIIHLHNIHGYYINIEILFDYLKEINKPVIWTLHDCWSFTGHCAYFDYVQCEKWKTGCNKCPERRNYPASILLDNSTYNYNNKKDIFNGVKDMTIVTPSIWLSKLVKDSFLKDYSVEVINNGVDMKIFKPTPSNFKKKFNIEDKFIILGVASVWSRRKGLDDFIKLSEIIDNNFVIVLVGLNSTQLKKIPQKIIGISKTNNTKELAEIYSTADIFFNPTYEDNYPTTNIESLACGTPVITYDSGGSSECINDKNGLILKKGELKFQYFKDMIDKKASFDISDLKSIDKDNCYKKYGELYERCI